MTEFGLPFISDEDLLKHVSETVAIYRFSMNLEQFTKNLLDPIKLTFDSMVYGKTVDELIEGEVIRQIDKSNSNHIGYFNQNIFKYIGGDQWQVPDKGFDVINEERHIFVEMKNKHNTMNSSSAQKTYTKMQEKILRDSSATCLLVEVIAKKSQNIPWRIKLSGEYFENEHIRRVSIDQFYELVTGHADAFKQLTEVLPHCVRQVVQQRSASFLDSTVLEELEDISPDLLESLYALSFSTYEGFSSGDR